MKISTMRNLSCTLYVWKSELVFLFSFSGVCGYFDNKGQEGTKQQRKDLSHNESQSSLLTEIHDTSVPPTQFTVNAWTYVYKACVHACK